MYIMCFLLNCWLYYACSAVWAAWQALYRFPLVLLFCYVFAEGKDMKFSVKLYNLWAQQGGNAPKGEEDT